MDAEQRSTQIDQFFVGKGELEEIILETLAQERQFGLKRSTLPIIFIRFSQNNKGNEARELCNRFSSLAQVEFQPETDTQRGYFARRQNYACIYGILLVHKMLGLLPYPDALLDLLAPNVLKHLILKANIDCARFELLKAGDRILREFANHQGKAFPFSSPLEYFLYILQEEYKSDEIEAFTETNITEPPVPKNFQKKIKDPGPQKLERNEQRKWRRFLDGKLDDEIYEQEVIEGMKEYGYRFFWILVLRDYRNQKPFKKLWDNYLGALQEGEELFITKQFWKNGELFLPKKTKQRAKVKIHLDKPNLNIDWA